MLWRLKQYLEKSAIYWPFLLLFKESTLVKQTTSIFSWCRWGQDNEAGEAMIDWRSQVRNANPLEMKVSYVKQERLWMSIWFSHQKIQSTPYYYRGGVRCEGKRRRDSVCHYWLVVARKTRIFCAGTSRSGCTAWYMPGSACRQRGRNKCSKVVEFSNWQTNWMSNSICPLHIW